MELLPCPFCEDGAFLESIANTTFLCRVKCVCGLQTDAGLRETVIEKWNTRPTATNEVCPECNGTGEDGHDREYPPNPYVCETCNGTGKQPTNKDGVE